MKILKFFQIDRELNYGRSNIKKIVSEIKLTGNILDIGAGFGKDLEIYKHVSPKSNLYAIECYPDAVSALNLKKITTFPINLEREKIPTDNEFFKLVSTNQFLEHTKEIFFIFHEMLRVLEVGGYLMISIPNLASLHNRILLMFGYQPTSIKTNSAHIRGFTKKDLLDFINTIFPDGMELIDFKGSNFYPFPPFLANPLSSLFPNLSWGSVFLFKKIHSYNNQFIKYPVEKKYETNFYYGD
jgi:SAM-dependent methyltransferase